LNCIQQLIIADGATKIILAMIIDENLASHCTNDR
jgi:hypothetical protein